jgi:hypothetical protein
MKVPARGGGLGKKQPVSHRILTPKESMQKPTNSNTAARAPKPATIHAQRKGEYHKHIEDRVLENFMFPLWELTAEEYHWLTYTKSKTRRNTTWQ